VVEDRVELLARRAALALRRRQHQAGAAAVEERHARRRLEQEAQAEHVAVERHRAGKIRHREGNLSDPRDADVAAYCSHAASSPIAGLPIAALPTAADE